MLDQWFDLDTNNLHLFSRLQGSSSGWFEKKNWKKQTYKSQQYFYLFFWVQIILSIFFSSIFCPSRDNCMEMKNMAKGFERADEQEAN